MLHLNSRNLFTKHSLRIRPLDCSLRRAFRRPALPLLRLLRIGLGFLAAALLAAIALAIGVNSTLKQPQRMWLEIVWRVEFVSAWVAVEEAIDLLG